MPKWMILLAVANSALMAFLLITGRIKLNVNFKVDQAGTDSRALLGFIKDEQSRISEYLRANWSGSPEHLPQVLESLLGELDRDARERGVTIDREMLKTLLAQSVRAMRIVGGRDLEQAMERVA